MTIDKATLDKLDKARERLMSGASLLQNLLDCYVEAAGEIVAIDDDAAEAFSNDVFDAYDDAAGAAVILNELMKALDRAEVK